MSFIFLYKIFKPMNSTDHQSTFRQWCHQEIDYQYYLFCNNPRYSNNNVIEFNKNIVIPENGFIHASFNVNIQSVPGKLQVIDETDGYQYYLQDYLEYYGAKIVGKNKNKTFYFNPGKQLFNTLKYTNAWKSITSYTPTDIDMITKFKFLKNNNGYIEVYKDFRIYDYEYMNPSGWGATVSMADCLDKPANCLQDPHKGYPLEESPVERERLGFERLPQGGEQLQRQQQRRAKSYEIIPQRVTVDRVVQPQQESSFTIFDKLLRSGESVETRVQCFLPDKDFGFVELTGNNEGIFFHRSALVGCGSGDSHSRIPMSGERVRVVLGRDNKGRPQCTRVELLRTSWNDDSTSIP